MDEVVEKPKRVKKEKIEPEHVDILGQPIKLGGYVAMSHHNTLQICTVTKINPKTVRVNPLFGYYKKYGYQISPIQAVLLSGPDALAYILANAGRE